MGFLKKLFGGFGGSAFDAGKAYCEKARAKEKESPGSGRGDYVEAIKCYDQFIALEPERYDAYLCRACCHQDLGQMKEAEDNFKKCLDHDPHHDIYFLLLLYLQTKEYDKALELIDSSFAREGWKPDSLVEELFLDLVYALIDEGDFDRTIRFAKKLWQKDPEDAFGCVNMGVTYFEVGRAKEWVLEGSGQSDYLEAIKYCDRAILLGAGQTSVYSVRGKCHQGLGAYKDAEEDFKRDINERPDFGISYTNLAELYFKTKEHDKCIQVLDDFYVRNPQEKSGSVDGYSKFIADFFESQGEHDKAKNILDKVAARAGA